MTPGIEDNLIERIRRLSRPLGPVPAGVEAKIHYPIPLHLQEAASDFGYKRGDFPITEAQAGSIITLPVHQHLTGEHVEYVIETIRAFYS